MTSQFMNVSSHACLFPWVDTSTFRSSDIMRFCKTARPTWDKGTTNGRHCVNNSVTTSIQYSVKPWLYDLNCTYQSQGQCWQQLAPCTRDSWAVFEWPPARLRHTGCQPPRTATGNTTSTSVQPRYRYSTGRGRTQPAVADDRQHVRNEDRFFMYICGF